MSSPTDPERHDRRSLLIAAGIGGTVGGLWTSWFAQSVTGNRSQLFVLGDEAWQLILIEDHATRIVVVAGEAEVFPTEAVEKILGTLRQRVDILIAPPTMLSHFSLIRPTLDIPVRESLPLGAGADREIRFGKIDVKLRTIHASTWLAGSEPTRSWNVAATLDDCPIAIGPSLDTLVESSPAPMLAIAPIGDPAAFVSRNRGASCAVNAVSTRDLEVAPLTSDSAKQFLVRTFPEDIARFIATGDRLNLPRWAQRIR